MKDRFDAFQRLTGGNGSIPLDEGQSNSEAQLSADTSRYLETAFKVQAAIEELKELVTELDKVQNSVVTSTLQDAALERQLADCEARTKSACNSIGLELKAMDQCLQESESRGATVETRMKRDQLSALRRVFETAMSRYNNALLGHQENCKKRLQRQLQITGTKKTDEQIEKMLEVGNLNVMMNELVVDTKDAANALKEVESRHEDILRLEKSIKDLYDLFSDMAAHVAMQSDILDRIDFNVARTATTINDALPKLKKARYYKKPKLFQWFSS